MTFDPGHIYLEMDAELTAVHRTLSYDEPGIDAASYYGASDPADLAAHIRSLPALPEVAVPIRSGKLEVKHRFVREDIPYGISVVRHIVVEQGLPCTVVTIVLQSIRLLRGRRLSHWSCCRATLIRLPPRIGRRRREASQQQINVKRRRSEERAGKRPFLPLLTLPDPSLTSSGRDILCNSVSLNEMRAGLANIQITIQQFKTVRPARRPASFLISGAR